jgi:DNA-binding response OmpR family regulator
MVLIQQPDGSMREVLLHAERVVLGRAETCDIVLTGRLISRQHACIRSADHGYLLEDLGSHNGTTLNGQRVSGTQSLHDGDCIELGGICKLFFVDDDATNTRPLPPATGLWLDEDAQDVWIDGQCLRPQLSPAQFCLLRLLIAQKGRVCSRAEIVACVWPDTADGVSEDAVDSLIKRLRARLNEIADGDRYVQNVRGRGLILQNTADAR